MQKSSKQWLVPLTGVAAIVVLIASFAIHGEPTEAKDGADKVVDFYVDNKDALEISALMGALSGVLMIFFFAYLRKFFRAAEGEDGTLFILPVIGAAIFAVGITIDGSLTFAMAEAADNDVDPTAILTLQAFWDNDFLTFLLGAIVILFSAGITVLRTGVLPKWLGWVAIALGVVSFTPLGFAGVIGLALWVLIVSVMLTLRARSGATA